MSTAKSGSGTDFFHQHISTFFARKKCNFQVFGVLCEELPLINQPFLLPLELVNICVRFFRESQLDILMFYLG